MTQIYKTNAFVKQFLLTTSFLGTSIPTAKVLSKWFKYLDSISEGVDARIVQTLAA